MCKTKKSLRKKKKSFFLLSWCGKKKNMQYTVGSSVVKKVLIIAIHWLLYRAVIKIMLASFFAMVGFDAERESLMTHCMGHQQEICRNICPKAWCKPSMITSKSLAFVATFMTDALRLRYFLECIPEIMELSWMMVKGFYIMVKKIIHALLRFFLAWDFMDRGDFHFPLATTRLLLLISC